MTLPEEIASLIAPLAALQRLMDRFDSRGVIIGGIAAGLLGQPRLTVDLDAMFLATFDDIPRLLEMAQQEGIEPRTKDVIGFARKTRVLVLQHTASKANIDLSLGVLPFEEEVVARSIVRPAGAILLRLPTPEDLIILKAVAHRPKDLLDIQAVAENNPDLDTRRIETWVKSFADILELPDLWGNIKKILDEVK